MHRLVIFIGPGAQWSVTLLNEALAAARKRSDIAWIGVCVTAEDRPRGAPALLNFGAKLAFNPRQIKRFPRPRLTSVDAIAKKHGAEIILAPRYRINNADFIGRLRSDHAPDLALSLACLQIWGPDLLESFELAVNYHNGYLPDYKGLWATHWSLYQGEPFSGYAFHVMDRDIDTGEIILRGRVAVHDGDSPASLERRKLRAACNDLDKVLGAMTSGRIEAQAQPGGLRQV